jgi:hypothetical protein
MDFKIHKLKMKIWNNSYELLQLQWYIAPHILFKNDTKQNKDKNNYNNNEH